MSAGFPDIIRNHVFKGKHSFRIHIARAGKLDLLGRCGVCMASIGQDIMPTEERGEIGGVRPSGWHTVKYPGIKYIEQHSCPVVLNRLCLHQNAVGKQVVPLKYWRYPVHNMIAGFPDIIRNHGNIPYFEDSELSAESYEYYSELDLLGRCGVCMAS